MASDVLIEIFTEIADPFETHSFAVESTRESERQAESALEGIGLKG